MSQYAVDLMPSAQPNVFAEPIREDLFCESIRMVISSQPGTPAEGLRALFGEVPRIDVVGVTSDRAAALALVSGAHARVLLLDVTSFEESEMHFLRRTRRWMPHLRILLVAKACGRQQMISALEQGAHGVVPKESATAGLLRQAVLSVAEGDCWLGEKRIRELREIQASPAIPADHGGSTHRFGLTTREVEVLPLLMQGYTNPQIAKALQISTQTVKHHLAHIFDKVGVSNRLELALFVINHRLIGKGSPVA